MSTMGVITDPVVEVLDGLATAIDVVRAMPLMQCDAAGQVDVAVRLEELRRRFEFVSPGAVQQLEVSGAANLVGAPTTSALLQYRMRLPASEANARVRAAKSLCEGSADGRTCSRSAASGCLRRGCGCGERGARAGDHNDHE